MTPNLSTSSAPIVSGIKLSTNPRAVSYRQSIEWKAAHSSNLNTMTIEIQIPSEVDINHLESIILTIADYSENVTSEEFSFLYDLFTQLKK